MSSPNYKCNSCLACLSLYWPTLESLCSVPSLIERPHKRNCILREYSQRPILAYWRFWRFSVWRFSIRGSLYFSLLSFSPELLYWESLASIYFSSPLLGCSGLWLGHLNLSEVQWAPSDWGSDLRQNNAFLLLRSSSDRSSHNWLTTIVGQSTWPVQS